VVLKFRKTLSLRYFIFFSFILMQAIVFFPLEIRESFLFKVKSVTMCVCVSRLLLTPLFDSYFDLISISHNLSVIILTVLLFWL
jgi:hypothetical protein